MNRAKNPAPGRPRAGTDDLRRALGQFATGVAVVTTRAPSGRSVGLTVNSFASVSLEPPLVLWSLSKHSSSLDAFTAARTVAIHVLSAGQEALARRFASSRADRFAGIPRGIGPGGVPLLEGGIARFICSPHAQQDTGDHVIFVMRVDGWERAGGQALVFHAGRFCEIERNSMHKAAASRLSRTGGSPLDCPADDRGAKGNDADSTYLRHVGGEAKASERIARAIEKAGFRGVSVAPPAR
jgi:flavin reductase (DIM6/NTAB) family NADH-FMN oxidoreductase RutF